MNVLEFIKTNNLDYQPLKLYIKGDEKKSLKIDDYYPRQNDYRKLPKQELVRRQSNLDKVNAVAIHTDDLYVLDVDFDDDKEYEKEAIEYVEEMKKILPWKKSNTKKRGCHLYFYPEKKAKKTILKKFPFVGMEVLTGQWAWSLKEGIVHNFKNEIPTYNILEMGLSKPKKEPKKEPKREIEPKKEIEENDTTAQLILNMPKESVEKYPEWFETLVKIKTLYGESYRETAKELSRKSSKFGNFDKTWDAINVKKREGVKMLDPAEDFYNIWKDNIVVNTYNGRIEIYLYKENKKIWVRDDRCLLLKHNIAEVIKKEYYDILSNNRDDDRDIEKDRLKELMNVKNNKWRTNISEVVIQRKLAESTDNIEFDSKNYLYHFDNVTLDLTDLSSRERVKEDYCTMLGAFLKPRNTEKIEKWDSIFKSIFTDEEVRDCYKRVICNSFSGRVLQKFIVCNGGGSNGKSMLDNCWKALHKDYYYKGSCTDLCLANKGGANPSLANCNRKRFKVWSEPEEGHKLQVSTIKDISGEETINSRVLYSNNTECNMGGIAVLECNKRLGLNGDTGYSTLRRFIDFHFKSTFKAKDGITEFDSPYSEENPEGYMIADPYLETKEFRDENISDLFYYLFDFMTDEGLNYHNLPDFILPKSVKDRSNAYILDNNPLLTLIKLYCEESKGSTVTLKEIRTAMEDDTNYYQLLSKAEKRNLTAPKLKKKLQEDPQLSKNFKENCRKLDLKNVLINWKLKEEEPVEKKCVVGDSDSE